MREICGIDEAGRGSLAGPLVVAACATLGKIDGLDDSKTLSSKKREELFLEIVNNATFTIIWFSHRRVDEWGLSKCLKNAILRVQKGFPNCEIIMDGNTTFGANGVKSIIKADKKIKEVSAASILAKVARDRYMIKMDSLYPNYSFSSHKGYGTKKHLKLIEKYGSSPIQRDSFIVKSFRQKTLF
ncbi:MAG: ribonuclease HII [Sulfurospirillaceae bacterium]|jgi:ribonuclease HII|nr:ribonuclease HII [Sulfurospirillaceae bacterium]MCK9545951.1 ribonuclease HII [Sulfurospirillaceae bacterium]MDY0238857.1 ribonuclease HII [Campylobacterales bacterium]NLM98777.1 ribonuclease HII [Campylobacteraceae bacterium]